jgi:hypothetical protein
MQENDSCEKIIYMGDVQGPEKVNNAYVKTVHAGMMDRGFTVYPAMSKVSLKRKMPSKVIPVYALNYFIM